MKPLVSNIRFIVQSLPKENHSFLDEEEKFQEKLLRLSENTFSTHTSNLSTPLRTLQEHLIQRCVVGPKHLAFRLDNGSVCRIAYSAALKSTSSKLPEDVNKEKGKTGTRSSKMIRRSSHSVWGNLDFLAVTGSGSWSRWGSRGVVRSSGLSGATATTEASSARKTIRTSSNSNSSDSITSSGIRLIRANQVRGRNLPLFSGSQKMVVPASHVPEELINQVQNVLQGKSRSVILKELQRTHLDVNMAVNNLLSRDDEDNDDMEDGASDYIPGEELMSLLDSGMGPGDHARVVIDADAMLPEDLLGYTFSSRSMSSGSRRGDNEDTDDSRSQNPQWSDLKNGCGVTTGGPKEPDVTLGECLEWWDEGDGLIKFKDIGSMHSELVGLDEGGSLRQWKWTSSKPTQHPKTQSLGLDKEKISFLATSLIQASVVTEEGGVATWMDDVVAKHATQVDIPHTVSDTLKNERVNSLHTCALHSVVLTEQNRIYWWGIPSYNQRKKLIEKSQTCLQHSLSKDSSSKQKLSVGDQVCLRSFPIYHGGAIAVNISGGFPKIGRLLQSVWRNDTKASFEILSSEGAVGREQDGKADDVGEEVEAVSTVEPSPSLRKWKTVIDNSSTDSSSRKRKRSEVDDEDDGSEESWDLKEVVFVEDAHPLPPVGRIAKVDENIVAVHFGTEEIEEKNPNKILLSCRLLHKDDVMLFKSSLSKPLERVQKTPKRLMVDSRFHLHCIDAGEGGITAVAGHDRDQLSFIKLSLSSGKVTSQRRFPTKADSFSDQSGESGKGKFSSKAKLLSCGSGSPTLLQDYNSMLYPLLGDENGGIRDPIWADIPPLCASGMGFCLDSYNTRSVLVVFAFRSQVLMPLIMSRDLKGFRSLLNTVESNRDAAWAKVFYQSLLNERCDGQRNVVHMNIEMSVPSSNKEQKEDEEAQSKMAACVEQTTSSRASPSKPSSSTASSESGSGSFLSDGDRMNAVSAIANAISCVRNFPASTSRDSPSPTRSISFPPAGPPFLLPRIEPASYASIPRSSAEFGGGNSPGSPISVWPCDLGTQWKPDDKKDEEKGMNLSKKASKDSWSEAGPPGRGGRLDAVAILKLLCKSKCIQPYLKQLLKHKDSNGYTPFLFAVAHRAYPAALAIFKAAYSIAMDSPVAEESMKENYKSFASSAPMDSCGHAELLSMLYPPGSDPDDNPVHMLCCNDTCSFTWTGALHINQDIFECLTCGLTETLCCCTECARVCHKGHDCKLKRTSPTAYCDCWEKCACRSLVEGSVPDRTALLRVLLHTTDLYERYNSKGEHIIHFLIKTVARQSEEQRQYRPPPRGSANSRHPDDQRQYRHPPRTARMSTTGSMRHRSAVRTLPPSGEQDMPEHDLRPPQFCREALLQLLSDFHAVRSLLFSGCENRRDELSLSSKLDQDDSLHNLLPEDKRLLSSQSGTSRLDSFTHTLIVKCSSPEYLNRLLETLIHAVQVNKHREHDDGVIMARRFLRSVIRIFIVLTAQSTPDKLAAKLSLYNQSALAKCRRAFTALITLSIEELCETAEALIAPVRMGVAKPTSAYPLFGNVSDTVHGSTAAFSKLPLPPRTRHSEDDDDGENDKQNKRSSKKSRKKSKRSKSRPIGGLVGGEELRARETANDESSDHNMAAQDSQPAEDEPIDGLQRLFRDISDQIEADARNEDVELVEEESDMEITDIDVTPESDSDSADSDREDPPLFLGERPSRDRESQHDEEDEDADGHSKRNEEEDTDSDAWQDEVNLERRSTREQRAQARETPHTMQWAMGARSMVPIKGPVSSTGIQSIGSSGGGSTGGVNYVNSRSMRRNDSTLENTYLNTVLDRRHGMVRLKHSYVDDVRGTSSIGATNAQLSRLFSTCIREVVQLLSSLNNGAYMSATTLGTLLEVSYRESSALREYVHHFLERTWKWLLVVVQSTESQLHYGQVLSMTSNPHHPDHPHYKGGTHRSRGSSRNHGSSSSGEDHVARQDFISYILSLMRFHSGEHSDILPVVDVSSMKHIAYVLDAYIYYLRALSNKPKGEGKNDPGTSNSQGISLDIGDNEEEEEEDQMSYQDDLYSAALQSDSVKTPQFPDNCSSMTQPPSLFFHRSESMTFLGCSDSNTFEVPLATAIPLAEKPHLLRPTSRKEELFGRPRGSGDNSENQSVSLSLSTRTTTLGVSGDFSNKKGNESQKTQGSFDELPPPSYSSLDVSSAVRDPGPSHESPQKHSSDALKAQSPTATLPSGYSKMETDDVTKKPVIDAVAMETPMKTVTVDTNEEESSSKRHEERRIEKEIASAHSVLARCRLTLELFSRMFLDSVGAEAKSILYELGGFEVREVKFRKEMERIRTSQTVDLHLNVERNREQLIQQTFKQLNQQAKRRSGSSQPLAVLRVKVQFENEPGEGTGVARSFYTAIAEALLSPLRLPNLDSVLPGSTTSSNRKSSSMHLSLVARLYKREREREERSNRGSSRTTASSGGSSERSINLRSFLTARYRELATGGQRETIVSLSTQAPPFVKRPNRSQSGQSSLERSKQAIGDRLFPKVSAIHSTWPSKITGMLLELPAYELLLLLRSERSLHERVSDAASLLVSSGYSHEGGEEEPTEDRNYQDDAPPDPRLEKKTDEKSNKTTKDEEEANVCVEADGGPPLFYQPGKRGVYAPASWGDISELRLNAYRNVGRLVGLCLLQNELCPLPLCRHVLKAMLGRKIHWHDLAFFDPVLYESLRQLVADSQSWGDDVLEAVDLTFMVDLQNEEGGGQVELTPGGASLPVTKGNLMDYIRRYALYRMIGCCKKQLDKMRQGLFDVLPTSALHYLTAEDLRLLFNGCGHVDVRSLVSYTMFNDESGKSGASAEKLTQLKRWFWAVVDKMNQVERQELLYFWTGSPALPASEDGFQPMPTITIRPPDDHHLPTANTCISRLYVPLYSSRQILRQKLLLAIKTKNFGFV